MKTTTRIDYKQLRTINPETARLAVLEYLKTNKRNISSTALVFGVNRPVIYDIMKKEREGSLTDRSKIPHHQPRRTVVLIEDKVVEFKNKTHLGPKRLSRYLKKYEEVVVAPGTIRHIVRRNKHRLTYLLKGRRSKREKRPFVDWYSAKPFEIVQMDIKFIRDQKALSKEQIIHLDRYHVPNYQWGALDVNSRFKLIGYSKEKTWSNGLLWYLWVTSWLRGHGVTEKIIFTVDNGEEFGGKSWLKVVELRKLIRGFNCELIQNHKGHPEENSQLERSHRTDDDEFYRLRVESIKSEDDLCDEALNYIYYYNNLREHSSLNDQTPFARLKQELPQVDDRIRYVLPIMLDKVAIDLGPWSGYNVLAQNLLKAHRRRYHWKGRTLRKDNIDTQFSFENRPNEVNNRLIVGHWETDDVEGLRTESKALSVTVERVTRVTRISLLSNQTGVNKTRALKRELKAYAKIGLVKTITCDRGKENSKYKSTMKQLKTTVYFCNAYHSWEKGTVENMNGRIRRYVPKKTSLENLTQRQITSLENILNNTPRKCLNFLTPNERMAQITNQLSVALPLRI